MKQTSDKSQQDVPEKINTVHTIMIELSARNWNWSHFFCKIKFACTPYLIILTIALASCYSDTGISGDPSVNGQGGSLARFTIRGDYLYTLDEFQLHTFNITQASNPVSSSTGEFYNGLETVFTQEGYLYIGTRDGMMIYDLTNPGQPNHVSTYHHVVSCDPVVVKGDFAFVTLNTEHFWCGRHVNELQIIDISNKFNPKKVNSFSMDSPKGLGVKDNLLFICDDALEVYNLDNLPDIGFVEKFNIQAHDVIPMNDKLLVIGKDGLRQYRYETNSITLISEIKFGKETN